MKLRTRWVLCRPEDGGDAGGGAGDGGGENGSPSGDFDLGAAFDEVAAEFVAKGGLNDDDSGEHTSAAKPAAPAPAPTAGAPAPAPTPAAPVPAPAGPDLTKAPSTWRAETATKWAGLDPEIQAEIHRRESDFHKGLETYKADAQVGKPFRQVLQPYEQIFAQYGVDPARHVAALLQINHTLALGSPEQKLAVFQQLAKDYGITMPDSNTEPGFLDPEVAALRKEIDDLKSITNRRDQEAAQQRRQTLAAEITEFASKNEHFDEVSGAMARILRADPGTPLKDAYDAACWSTPSVRTKLIAKQQADAEAERQTAERKRAEDAAAAAALNRKSKLQAGTVTGNTRLGSMDETMAATLAEIKARG